MVGINGLSSLYNQYDSSKMMKSKATEKKETTEVKKADIKKYENSESKLSEKGQEYLKGLREKYKDYDFIIADTEEDRNGIADASDKEIAVLMSSEEIEKMAGDEDYAAEKISQMESAIDMAKKLNEELANDSEMGDDVGINKIIIELSDDGSMKLFAELEKSSAKQRERIAANKEKKQEEEKAQEKKAEESKLKDKWNTKPEEYRQRTKVEASSADELLEKIKSVDWSSVPYDEIKAGDRIDFAV